MSWEEGTANDESRAPTRALDEEECWGRLAAAPYGRVVTRAADEIDVFPVNHRVDGRSIVFRTSAGTKLLELTIHNDVVFQVDGRDAGEAYSVVAKGTAEQLETTAEIEAVEPLGVRPWAPEVKDRWVRISPRLVTGRSFALRAEQQAE